MKKGFEFYSTRLAGLELIPLKYTGKLQVI